MNNNLNNRTAVVRDPYARWCGGRGIVRCLPIPIGMTPLVNFNRKILGLIFSKLLIFLLKRVSEHINGASNFRRLSCWYSWIGYLPYLLRRKNLPLSMYEDQHKTVLLT